MMLLPRARAPWRVTGKPLEASIEIGIDEAVIAGRYRRDDQGRSELVYLASDGVELAAVEVDPILGTITHRGNQGTQTANLGQGTGPSGETEWGYVAAVPEVTGEVREIQGLRCQQVIYRSIGAQDPHGESWVAFDDGLVLLDSDEHGRMVWRVSHLRLG